jgi:PknH-like extracellular domain
MSTDPMDIRRRLESLGSALGDTQLPGPDAARGRARQRSRRQAGGAVLGAVAAVAVGAIVIGGLPTLDTAPLDPADPAETPTSESDPLVLTVDDLEASGGDLVGWTATEPNPEPSFECAPGIGDADHVVQRSFVTSDGSRLDQIVEISTPDRAQARFDDVTESVAACVEAAVEATPDDYDLDQIWEIHGIGEDGWVARYSAPPRVDDGATLVTVSVALVGDTVTTVTQGGWAMDANAPPSDNLVRLAAERLCAASGRTCDGEPEAQRIHPPAVSDLAGWLTVEDVVQSSGIDSITDGGEIVDAEGTYGFACIEVNAAADGATSVERRSYFDPTLETVSVIDQAIAVFPSAAAAEDHFDRVAAEAGACADGPPTTVTGEVSGPGYRGISWRSTDEEFGTAFVFGAVVSGSAVSVLTFAVGSGDDPDLDADQFGSLLSRAGERLAELG